MFTDGRPHTLYRVIEKVALVPLLLLLVCCNDDVSGKYVGGDSISITEIVFLSGEKVFLTYAAQYRYPILGKPTQTRASQQIEGIYTQKGDQVFVLAK